MTPKAALTFRDAKKAEPYADAMRQAGIEPVLVNPDAPRALEGLRGLLVSGGNDLNPALYGSAPQAEDESPDDKRDELEATLLREALGRDVPLLAICRGMQLLNVVQGGTLIQHLENWPAHRVRDLDFGVPVHEIVIERGTRLAAIFGDGVRKVNSRHHQAVDRLGKGLRVTARSAPDGVVEALELPGRAYAVGVQWHPEDQVRKDAEQRKLFESFAQALR